MTKNINTIKPNVQNRQSINYLAGRLKRIFDIIGALIGLISLFPLFLIACIIVSIVDNVPVIFSQERIGLGGKPFVMHKLRTLKVIETRQMVNHIRIQNKPDYDTTLTGKFWRVTSVDEIVQFWQVLKGEMSLIGHRTIPIYYIPHLHKLENLDQEKIQVYLNTIKHIKPGMSSLASVNGRGNLTMQQKFNYDLVYFQKASFWYDLKLIYKTIIIVITCKGAK